MIDFAWREELSEKDVFSLFEVQFKNLKHLTRFIRK